MILLSDAQAILVKVHPQISVELVSGCRLLLYSPDKYEIPWHRAGLGWAAPTQSYGCEGQSQRKQKVYHLRDRKYKHYSQIPEVLDMVSTCEALEDPSQDHQTWRHASQDKEKLSEEDSRVNPGSDTGRGTFRDWSFGTSGEFHGTYWL